MNSNVIGHVILEGAFTAEDTIITGNGRRVTATGTLQDMDVKNRNGRIYSKVDLEPQLRDPRLKELLDTGNLCGEAGHPLSDDLTRQQTIDPKLTCVRFLKVWTEGNQILGNFQGTNNDYGNTFDQDLRCGIKPAFSLRALGSIEPKNGQAYVKNIKIITWDHVIFPSHKAAYTKGLLNESAVLTVFDNNIIVPHDDPGTIIKITDKAATEFLNKVQTESANMTKILESFGDFYTNATLKSDHTIVLSNPYGDKLSVNLEQHVQNSIMNWVSSELL